MGLEELLEERGDLPAEQSLHHLDGGLLVREDGQSLEIVSFFGLLKGAYLQFAHFGELFEVFDGLEDLGGVSGHLVVFFLLEKSQSHRGFVQQVQHCSEVYNFKI